MTGLEAPAILVDLEQTPSASDDTPSPSEILRGKLVDQLRNAIDAAQSDLLTYESLRNLSEVIGGEYGDRVVFELIQNAHDAHEDGAGGAILLRLIITGPREGDLYVANGGRGFDWKNVNAIRNVGVSSKSVGEGIGNKGLGFRSVETLTDDPRIYSQATAISADRFDGYCFRFARPEEVHAAVSAMARTEIADKVAAALPRYLAAMPIDEQDDRIRDFARQGYATVVHVPLRNENAVTVAREQVKALANAEAPLLLFLDRLARVEIQIDDSGEALSKTLTREVLDRPEAASGPDISYETIAIEPGGRRYLVAKKEIDPVRLAEAVELSIPKEPQLARWRNWRGKPTVSVAVALGRIAAETGRVYNFLPMVADIASPIRGHVDAPFYATIDRRRANMTLPLNAFLLDVLAETASTAARDLKPHASTFGRAAIFDLASWDPADSIRLAAASKRVGIEWQNALVVPAAGGNDAWTSIYSSWNWPETGFRLFRARQLVKAGVGDLADPDLGKARLDRLSALVAAANVISEPDAATLADWTERLALTLERDGVGVKTWASFYDEVHRAFKTPNALKSLKGKRFLRGRDGELHATHVATDVEPTPPVFVRQDGVSRSRDRDRAPLPPSVLSRKFPILDDAIPLKPEVIADFVKADLLRRYDALEVLASVQTLFGDKPAPSRRETALKWAFAVWRAEGAKSEKVLQAIDLHVEARGGWMPASSTRFSEGWTVEGRKLSTYLAEAARLSKDCELAAQYLLVEDPVWVLRSDPGRKLWTDFLRAAGVRDGLPFLSDPEAPESGYPSYIWTHFLRNESREHGRTSDWIQANAKVAIRNPMTNYIRRGELWRIPGQVEHQLMPSETRERLADLILIQLRQKDHGWLTWRIGRYDRGYHEHQETSFCTPAMAFLANAAWLPVDGSDGLFNRPNNLWSTSDRRQRPPRFVPRPKERLAELIEDDDQLSKLMLGPQLRLLDWAQPDTSARKLFHLARSAPNIEPRDRVNFRRAYQRSWRQLVDGQLPLTFNVALAVTTNGNLEMLSGNKEKKPTVYIASDLQTPEARAIAASGQPLLELGEDELVAPVLKLLNARDLFDARRVDSGQIAVLTDGEPFAPSQTDALLVGGGLEWLVDGVALANEILGRDLERQISAPLVEQRLRRIRVRHCERVTLSVDGFEVEETLPFYAFADDMLPTLVIGDGAGLDWSTLSDAAPHLSNLLDRRMRSLEMLLLRLAAKGGVTQPNQRPSDDMLARALGCSVDLVRDHSLASRADETFVLNRLIPVLACYIGIEGARSLQDTIVVPASRATLLQHLAQYAANLPIDANELLDVILETPDLAEVRRRLDIDYAAFNRVLSTLDLPILSNEAELRRLFDTWRDELRPGALDRLRRHYLPAYEAGASLQDYVDRRSLGFVMFQTDWILDRETLERQAVAELIDAELTTLIGEDVPRELEELAIVRTRGRRTLTRFVDDVASIVKAWCFREKKVAGLWDIGSLEMMKIVDQKGLLDFAPIGAGTEIAHLVRAGLWPETMPESVALDSLGLDPDDLLGEKRRAEERRAEEARRRRLISFANIELDTGAKDFAVRLIEIAEAQMTDGLWLKRSRRRFTLAEMPKSDPSKPGGPGGHGGKRRRSERITEDTKTAMGMASEYLAGRFLAEKHKARFDDSCWVSRNRETVMTDADGEDWHGFDFRVRTVETEWRYEVKSSLDDSFEFEFTQNEMRVAAECAADGSRKYRILYVPFVFSPENWCVMELPNPMSEAGRRLFRAIGSGATRFKFQPN